MELAFIAPYEKIQTKAQSIIATNGYPARTFRGDLYDGVAAARKALNEGAHIIISRGGTARLIREELGIDVIEVGASYFQLLSFIQDHTTAQTRIAVVGFRPFINLTQPVCDILKKQHKTFEIKDNEPIEEVFDRVTEWQPDIVIGDAVSVKTAEQYSINFHLIESSMETIVDAFDRGMLVLNNLKKHIANAEKLAAVLNFTKDGAILVNADGIIEEINQRGCTLLGNARSELLNQSFYHLFHSNELDTAILKRKTTTNIVIPYATKRFAIDYILISPDNPQSSAVIRFQQVEYIQEAGNIIRKKLRDKGFYAKYVFEDIIHRSEAMKELLQVAGQYSKTTSNIMLQGETGTGKELFAQSIHNASPIADGPFVAVNCAALSGALLESELFGYAPGAFTGALRSGKTGLFELANDGTLFLDEITEIDIYLQAKLLRALQAHEIMRIGDNKIIPTNVRIISATNKNPAGEVAAGSFRGDLFFRLNVLDLQIPALRERKPDISCLFLHYFEKFAGAKNTSAKPPSEQFLRLLTNYSWPGNVRELENLVEKYVSLQGLFNQQLIETMILKPLAIQPEASRHNATTLEEIIINTVATTYREQGHNISHTAAKLNIDRNTVKRWLAKDPTGLQ